MFPPTVLLSTARQEFLQSLLWVPFFRNKFGGSRVVSPAPPPLAGRPVPSHLSSPTIPKKKKKTKKKQNKAKKKKNRNKSRKKFSERKQVHVGMEPSKPTKLQNGMQARMLGGVQTNRPLFGRGPRGCMCLHGAWPL